MSDTTSVLALLNKQNDQLGQLERLLKDEYEILQQHNPDKLLEINQLKNTLLTQIDSTDKLLANTPEFVENKAKGEYSKELEKIEGVLVNCKDLNKINGDIIQKSQLTIERMRTTLLENNTRSTMTYDNKGKTSAALSSLDLKA